MGDVTARITEERLELPQHDVSRIVQSDACGAVSVFLGTTRGHFDGKRVTRLVYEAYIPMAESKMRELGQEMQTQFGVQHVAILHKIGPCPVGDVSVAIAASSVHRKEAMEAVMWCIDTLKATVPIWKKEEYADDEHAWKANQEFIAQHNTT